MSTPQSIYDRVTDQIVTLLESQLEDFSLPWSCGKSPGLAKNLESNVPYRGINQLLLLLKGLDQGYASPFWMTFRQCKKLGGTIAKGSTGSMVTYFSKIIKDKNGKKLPLTEENLLRSDVNIIPFLRSYSVFNVHQTIGLPDGFYEIAGMKLEPFVKDERAEELLFFSGAEIQIMESKRAFYDRHADLIVVPLREQFKASQQAFYSTCLHELAHWTGHHTRLDREFGNSMEDPAYAKEELIAELAAVFCSARLGFDQQMTQNAAYLKSWIELLQKDSRIIFAVANYAQKAADYIFSKSGTTFEEYCNLHAGYDSNN